MQVPENTESLPNSTVFSCMPNRESCERIWSTKKCRPPPAAAARPRDPVTSQRRVSHADCVPPRGPARRRTFDFHGQDRRRGERGLAYDADGDFFSGRLAGLGRAAVQGADPRRGLEVRGQRAAVGGRGSACRHPCLDLARHRIDADFKARVTAWREKVKGYFAVWVRGATATPPWLRGTGQHIRPLKPQRRYGGWAARNARYSSE